MGTLIGLFGIRPFMLKYAHRSSKVKTNASALVEKTGKVIVMIDNSRNLERVVVEGDNWRTETKTNETINVGEKVEVLEVNSTILIVKPLKK